MSDNWALMTLRGQLNEQRNYLRMHKELEAAARSKVFDAKQEVDRRQQMVDDLEAAIALLEGSDGSA